LTRVEKNLGFQKIEEFEIAPELAEKIGVEKKGFLGTTKKSQPLLVQHLKELSEAVQTVKSEIERGDITQIIAKMNVFIDPAKKGAQMIEYFFEEHREIRLFKIRLTDRGFEYLQANKQKMTDLFDHIQSQLTKKLRSTVQNT
jgi:hypothetical protein